MGVAPLAAADRQGPDRRPVGLGVVLAAARLAAAVAHRPALGRRPAVDRRRQRSDRRVLGSLATRAAWRDRCCGPAAGFSTTP